MSPRKTPVRHGVRSHTRKGGVTVVAHTKGKGEKKSRPSKSVGKYGSKYPGQLTSLFTRYNKAPHRKLLSGRYLVEVQSAYFHNLYVSVTDFGTKTTEARKAMAHIPSALHEKNKDLGDSGEALFLWLDSPKKVKRFLDGRVTKIQTSNIGQSTGKNVEFTSH